jgi:hypothetical protein
MKTRILIINILIVSNLFCQNNDSFFTKFELSVNYGLAGNFFANYDYDVISQNGSIEPLYNEVFDELNFFQKNFVGTTGGFSINYNFNEKNAIILSFDRNMNQGKYNEEIILTNGTVVSINDIVLRQRNHFYSLTYRRSLNKKNNLYASIGINYLRHNQAEITVPLSANFVIIRERNYENAGFEEGGFVLGLEKYFYTSGQFELGIQSKLFLLTSNPGLVETITLAPVLRFKF